jgi:hypothetical protein
MNLTIANISTEIGSDDFQAAVAAIGRQVSEDFKPEWGIDANLRGATLDLGNNPAPIVGNHDAIIYLGDQSQDPNTGIDNALGYHADNFEGVPYGFVYLDVCAEIGEPWSSVLSHEVLELLGDPTAAIAVIGPAPDGSGDNVYYDLEVCDPTQGDLYQIDSVTVSNFVGQAYFGLPGGSGDTNYLKLDLQPFGVRPNGYFQYEDSDGSHQIQGDKVTTRQLAAKKRMKIGRRVERRKARKMR